ncbi:MAG: hypothetical protein NNA20_04465 [Nitrospira sp.]|nr:hypothetical protein [Nitrospira sp.]MCP9441825.1 hypothetical protein [Nitrospira sp.]
MNRRILGKLAGLIVVGAIGAMEIGCWGLDGIRGTVVAIENDHQEYLVRDARGRQWRLWTDEHTRKDPVRLGDDIRVFAAKNGYAAYMMKLNGQEGS